MATIHKPLPEEGEEILPGMEETTDSHPGILSKGNRNGKPFTKQPEVYSSRKNRKRISEVKKQQPRKPSNL